SVRQHAYCVRAWTHRPARDGARIVPATIRSGHEATAHRTLRDPMSREKHMKAFNSLIRPLVAVTALSLAALVAGCPNGDGNNAVQPNAAGAGTGVGGLG